MESGENRERKGEEIENQSINQKNIFSDNIMYIIL